MKNNRISKRIPLNQVEEINKMIKDYGNNIDWINYDNINDVHNLSVAKELDERYHNKHSHALLEVSKAFTNTKAGDRSKQGKLILEAMSELSKLSDDGLPS